LGEDDLLLALQNIDPKELEVDTILELLQAVQRRVKLNKNCGYD